MCNAYPRRYAKSSPDREIRVLGSAAGGAGIRIRKDSPRRILRERLLRSRRRGYRDYDEESGSGYSGSASHSNSHPNSAFSDSSSGITSNRRSLRQAQSSDRESDPWDPHANTFHHIRPSDDPKAVISPFQNQEETVDFLTPEIRRNDTISRSFSLPPPSLAELESLASFSNASPSPEHGITDPSPVHPNQYANHRVPSHMVLSSTLTSLREPGVRLSAHGTQCEPRRIWIQLDVHKELLEWRTENRTMPKQTPNSEALSQSESNPNDLEISYTLGPKHTIPLKDILYVDVGKTTAALQMLSEDNIRSDMCFSILTKNGSLDLNAGNRLERDALISCMCLILDTVYADESNPDAKSWRDLHISDGSVTSRSTGTGTQGVFSYSSGGGTPSSASGYQGGTSSVGNFNANSASDVPTESDVYAGIETINEGIEE